MHIRQFVRDALVAVNAGFAGFEAFRVLLDCAASLFGKIHKLEVMAVAAFATAEVNLREFCPATADDAAWAFFNTASAAVAKRNENLFGPGPWRPDWTVSS